MARRRRRSSAEALDSEGRESSSADARERNKSRDEIFKQGSLLDLLTNILLLTIPALLVAATILPTETVGWTGCGLLLVVLWLILLLVWCVRGFLKTGAKVRFGLIDFMILGTVTWHSISVLIMVSGETGHARPAINMGWEWIGFGVCYFLVRQTFTTYRRQLALLMVMTCLATALASSGAFQFFHVNQGIRNAYRNASEEEKQEQLQGAGVNDAAIGSRERTLFENRLNSVEPLANFTLTNTLAGFITPWVVVAFGFWAVLIRYLHLRENESGEIDQMMLLALSVALLLMVGCLVLTKSRTAWLATGVGTVMIVLTAFAKADSVRRILLYYIGGAVLVLVIFAIWFGGLDLDVLKQGPLSLKYRAEYWSATSGMIRENAMFGVGPGNFQTNYVKHQLPQASEEISDPHNFLLELAATAGIPAMLMFGAGLFFWFWRVFPATRTDAEESPDIMDVDFDEEFEQHRDEKTRGEPPHNDTLLLCGAIIGVGVGYVFALAAGFSPQLQSIIVGTITAAILAAVFVHYMRSFRAVDTLPIGRWVLAAAAAMYVNLLASGGIGFPAVSLAGMTLLAIGLNVVHDRYTLRSNSEEVASSLLTTSEIRFLDKTWLGALFIGGTLLAIACVFTAVRPVTMSRPLMLQAEAAMQTGNRLVLVETLERLEKVDPHNSDIRRMRMEFEFMRWEGEGFRETAMEPFELAVKDLIKSNPRSAGVRRIIAGGYIRAFRGQVDKPVDMLVDQSRSELNVTPAGRTYIEQAVSHLQTANKLRPNDALLKAQLAWATQAGGDSTEAVRIAERAKELNDLNTHADRDLKGVSLIPEITGPDQRQLSNIYFPENVESDDQNPDALDAEQWIEVLRTMEIR